LRYGAGKDELLEYGNVTIVEVFVLILRALIELSVSVILPSHQLDPSFSLTKIKNCASFTTVGTLSKALTAGP